jgi:hypothetical protein
VLRGWAWRLFRQGGRRVKGALNESDAKSGKSGVFLVEYTGSRGAGAGRAGPPRNPVRGLTERSILKELHRGLVSGDGAAVQLHEGGWGGDVENRRF